jgi:hypothetical protein
MNREEERNKISQEELEDALRAVGLFLCNNYYLDCTNGMTLRTKDRIAITSGWNSIAEFFFLPELERVERELATYQTVMGRKSGRIL